MEIANARIPYASTLVQIEGGPRPNKYGLAMGGEKLDQPMPGAPA